MPSHVYDEAELVEGQKPVLEPAPHAAREEQEVLHIVGYAALLGDEQHYAYKIYCQAQAQRGQQQALAVAPEYQREHRAEKKPGR